MKKRVIALGFFDGVHMGHGALLKRTKEIAKEKNLSAAILLFDRHPSQILPGSPTTLINTNEEREMLLSQYYEMDEYLYLTFDEKCASISWDSFISDVLVNDLNAVHLVAGFDFRFGKYGKGDSNMLKAFCRGKGIGCDIIDPVEIDGEVVSSTLIRAYLEQGYLQQAKKLLGHNHIFTAPVVRGKEMGRDLGVPTINQDFAPNACVPRFGVYKTLVHIDNEVHVGVTNVGIRPTIEVSDIPRLETYILNYDGDLYGKNVTLEFVEFIRVEQKFGSMEELKQMIQKDIKIAES